MLSTGKLRVSLLLLACACACHAQDAVQTFADSVTNKAFVLRSFSGDSDAKYDWANGALTPETVKLHMFGTFSTRSAQIEKGKIVLHGDASVQEGSHKDGQPVSMTVTIALHGADPASITPQLAQALFFPDMASAIAALPKEVAGLLPLDQNPGLPAKCSAAISYDETTSMPMDIHAQSVPAQATEPIFMHTRRMSHEQLVNYTSKFLVVATSKKNAPSIWLVRSATESRLNDAGAHTIRVGGPSNSVERGILQNALTCDQAMLTIRPSHLLTPSELHSSSRP